MIGSLQTGVSGLQQFQEDLEVIGNDIANVNTVGYKSARMDFQDALSQSLINSTVMQVGTGVGTAAITSNFTQGTPNTTGVGTDLAINGNGFFVVKDTSTGATYATRDGEFKEDANGYLVTNSGNRVQGYDSSSLSSVGDVNFDISTIQTSRVSTATTNLAAATLANTSAQANLALYNTTPGQVQTAVTAPAQTALAAAAASPSDDGLMSAATAAVQNALTLVGTSLTAANKAATANPTVTDLTTVANDLASIQTSLQTLSTDTATVAGIPAASRAASDFATVNTDSVAAGTAAGTLVTATATPSTTLSDAASAASAALTTATSALATANTLSISSFNIDSSGKLNVNLSDGTSAVLGQVLLQNFADPSALTKQGGNLYAYGTSAGPLTALGAPGAAGLGSIQSGALESSNVDLAGEMANLITAQRAFEANAKIITTSDEVLQDLVNLKR